MKPPHKTDLSTIPSIVVPQRGTKLEASATVEADTCRKYVVPPCLGDLSRRSAAKTEAARRRILQAAGWENVAEIIGKFGGADQLRNGVPKLQSAARDEMCQN